jgi:L-threonylcarbamoyladenylate synthase
MICSDNQRARTEAAQIIANGGLIAFRTDTFYGLGADPLNATAVAKIRELKGREDSKPILLLISDADQLERFVVNRSDLFERTAKANWPGPLTIIGAARPGLPGELTAGTNTIGVRLPADENVRALVRICGGALTATSANVSGRPAACTAKDVEDYFPTGIDLIIDGGAVTVTEPSTVLDLSEAKPRIVREGAIPRAALADLLK